MRTQKRALQFCQIKDQDPHKPADTQGSQDLQARGQLKEQLLSVAGNENFRREAILHKAQELQYDPEYSASSDSMIPVIHDQAVLCSRLKSLHDYKARSHLLSFSA